MDEYELEELGNDYSLTSDETGIDPVLFTPDYTAPVAGYEDYFTGEDLIGDPNTDPDTDPGTDLDDPTIDIDSWWDERDAEDKTVLDEIVAGGAGDSADVIKGVAAKFGKDAFNKVKEFFTDPKTKKVDWGRLATMGMGLYGASQSNTRTQPSGYQGKIPKYTATRQAPGPDGLLSGNVTYAPKGIAAAASVAPPVAPVAAPPAGGAPAPTGGSADVQKSTAPAYANDPEYLRLMAAVRAVRGDGGGIQTMDYKPEEQALDAYIRRQNPYYRSAVEADKRQAADAAKLGLAGVAEDVPAPVYDPAYIQTDFGELNFQGENENPSLTPKQLEAYKSSPGALSGIAKIFNNAQAGTAEVAKAKGGALESGGFVIPADVVSHLGNGSSEAGLRLLAQRYGATPIKGKGDGMSDSIKTTIDGRQPARVANEEARLTKNQVNAAGGAKKLYAMMEKIRQARTGTKEQGKQIDPRKYMPGGAVQQFTAGGTTLPTGTTGTESSLSNWAGEYVTDMLGKGQALTELPYEAYKGDLSAGASDLQTKLSTGLNALSMPGNLGKSFSSTDAPTIGADGQPTGGGGIASSYMNPYLSAVLNPQLAEMRRQAEINNQSSLGGLTKSGAFGGGRQAIMESESGRNLLNAQTTAIGKGYSDAYDKGMGQFNTEQGQAKDLVGLMASQGAVDRDISADDIAAKKAQFEAARLNPYKMVQFQQSLLSGMPLDSKTYGQPSTNDLTQFADYAAAMNQALAILNGTAPAAKKT